MHYCSSNTISQVLLLILRFVGVDFELYTNPIDHEKQDVTMIFKVKGEGHSAKTFKNHISQNIGHRMLGSTCTPI